jgi:hypothetical protein
VAGNVLGRILKEIDEQNSSQFQDGNKAFTDFSLRRFSVIINHFLLTENYRFLLKALFGKIFILPISAKG